MTISADGGGKMQAEVGSEGAQAGKQLSKRELSLWTLGMLFAAREISVATVFSTGSLVDAIPLIAWGCAAIAIWRDKNQGPAKAPTAIFLLSLCAISLALLNHGAVTILAANAEGIFLIADRSSTSGERRCGMVLCAIAAQALWARMFVQIFAGAILRLDTAFVGVVMTRIIPGTVWKANIVAVPGGVPIAVEMPCSSFGQLSLVFLCFVSLCAIEKPPVSRARASVVLGALLALVVTLNTVRMGLMATSISNFYFWHDAAGATIYGVVISLLTVGLCSAGAQWAYARS
jgi:hypothetical protein